MLAIQWRAQSTSSGSAQNDVAQTVAGVAMAVTYDQGFGGVHSPHKQPVAHRMALALRRVALGDTLSPATEQGPELVGACMQSFDNTTNTTQVLVRLGNAQGLVLNATASCSDCCRPAGNKGMFHISVYGTFGLELHRFDSFFELAAPGHAQAQGAVCSCPRLKVAGLVLT